MLKKSLTLALFGALACNCALAQAATSTESAAQATGNIIFTGHVDRGSATVKVVTDAGTNTALADISGTTIALPTTTVANLVDGNSGDLRQVRIVLDGYTYETAGAMTYEVKLTGESASGDGKSLFKNEVTDATGANNVGVEVLYLGTNGQQTPARVTLGNPISSANDFDEDYSGNYTFHFTAGLRAYGTNLTSGKVQSTVNVSVTYK